MLSAMGDNAWAQTGSNHKQKHKVNATPTANAKVASDHKMPAKTSIQAKKPVTRQNRITPQIPGANRNQKNKIFLERADVLVADEKISTDYQILKNMYENNRKAKIIDDWVVKKQKETYVRIDDDWRNCEFKYSGWIKK